MKIHEILVEDVESQRISIKLGRMIVDYVNSNPQLARTGVKFKLIDIPQFQKYQTELINAAAAAGNTRASVSQNAAATLIDVATIHFEEMPLTVGGYYDTKTHVIGINPDRFDPKMSNMVVARPQPIGSTLAHEIQHGIDNFSGISLSRTQSQARVNALNQELERVGGNPNQLDPHWSRIHQYYTNSPYWSKFVGKKFNPRLPSAYTQDVYVRDPVEVNARLTQSLDQFARDAASDPKVAAALKANPEQVIGRYFAQYNLADLYPRGLADPEYRRLFSRAAKFIDQELKDPTGIATLRNPSFKERVIGFITGMNPANPAEIMPKSGKAVTRAAGRNLVRVLTVSADALTRRLEKVFTKQAANTLFKSIPFIGWGMAAYAAGERMLKGDYTGAGLEVISGAGSFLTAIPTLAAICARDLYNDCYRDPATGKMAVLEQDLAQDPEGTKQRLADLTNKISTEIKTSVNTFIQRAPR